MLNVSVWHLFYLSPPKKKGGEGGEKPNTTTAFTHIPALNSQPRSQSHPVAPDEEPAVSSRRLATDRSLLARQGCRHR